MGDDYFGNFLYSMLGDNAIEADQQGNLFVVCRLGTYYTTAAGTKEEWLARQQATFDGIATVHLNSGRSSAALPQTNPVSPNVLDTAVVLEQTDNNSGAAWYDRTWRELKAANSGWSDQQVTDEMTRQINLSDWNYNYKKLITDIANSSSPAERERKIADHKSELAAYRASKIDVDNDLTYLRVTQGEVAGQATETEKSNIFTIDYSFSSDLKQSFAENWHYSSQRLLAPNNPAFIDATLNDLDIAFDYRLDYNPNGVLWRVSAAGRVHPDDLEKFYQQQEFIQTAADSLSTKFTMGMGGPILDKASQSESVFIQGSSKATTVLADEVKVLAESPWTKGPITRGNIIDRALGNNLGRTFPTVDKLENGVLTSTKSLDVLAPTYQNEVAMFGRMKADIDALKGFQSGMRNGVFVSEADFTRKVFELALPEAQLTAQQLNAINLAKQYAIDAGIGFRIVVVK